MGGMTSSMGGMTSSMGGAAGGGGMSTADALYFYKNCECPVLSGFTSKQFCDAYAEICGFTGANRYASQAACMTGFKGGSSDADSKKAGALCCAYKMPDMRESRCAAAK
jgi:hypothetical protein